MIIVTLQVIYEDLPSNLCAIRDFVEKTEVANSPLASDEKIYMDQETASFDTENDEGYGTPAEQVSDSNEKSLFRQRPRVPGLQRDIEILKAELLKFIEEHGQAGFMPMRKQLRLHGRVDIEKAITRMGGFRRIASLMNLSLAYKHRKPKGYWDNLENLQEEVRLIEWLLGFKQLLEHYQEFESNHYPFSGAKGPSNTGFTNNRLLSS